MPSPLLAAASAAATVPATPPPCATCPEKRTYLIIHGAPGGNGRQFQIAAETHAKEIESNVVPTWMGTIRPFNKDCDTVVIVGANSGFDFNAALTSNTEIIYIAYFGHSAPFCLYIGYHTDTVGKCITAQSTNDFIYYDSSDYESDLASMHALSYNLTGIPPLADPTFVTLLFQVGWLDISNVVSGCTINLFGCRAGDDSSDHAARERRAVHPANPLGNVCIAQQIANHFRNPCHAFSQSSFFTDDKDKGHGKTIVSSADALRENFPSNVKDLWLLPQLFGSTAAFKHFSPVPSSAP